MVALDYLTSIHFSGKEAGDFLHNQLSADILALSDGESVFACYCEPKGRVLALMLVCRVDLDYYVIMSGALAKSVTARLKMYVMRSNVSIEVQDKSTVSALHGVEVSEPSAEPGITIPVPGGDKFLLIQRHELRVNSDTLSCEKWKAEELEQGICWLGPETSAQFLPQMLGFDTLGAVNFRKGCYPGQEIVARTRYLGKVKRHPRLLRVVADVCPGPLEKVQILCASNEYEAVVVDCVRKEKDLAVVFVVTRMDPELSAERAGFQGKLLTLR